MIKRNKSQNLAYPPKAHEVSPPLRLFPQQGGDSLPRGSAQEHAGVPQEGAGRPFAVHGDRQELLGVLKLLEGR